MYRFQRYAYELEELDANVVYEYSPDCEGLLLPGGGDIDPSMYGQKDQGSTKIDEERDEIEKDLLEKFMASRRPVFGICRGAQLINVVLGGTLHQDIPNHTMIEGHDRIHESYTTDETLKSLFGERFSVNSAHHQAIDRLGEGLCAIQWAPDGVIEAIRHESLPIFGVQWHPERLRDPIDGRRLLSWWLQSIK